jgi:glycosyltransferase involved in cell wall biosynthesis
VELADQETGGLFTYSIVVADNDELRSAETIVKHFSAGNGIPIRYCVERQQNISRTRNRAIENSCGDFIAFIDDDEFPIRRWLHTLFQTLQRYGADGVLGPVKPHFNQPPPEWVVNGGFYDRPSYPTGMVIDGKRGRTGNVLLKMELFQDGTPPFRPEFRTGEDQDFFRRMIEKGRVFVWCHEAMAYETVPPVRWKTAFMLRRALLRGATSLVHPTFGLRDIAKSLIAIPTYAAALPFAWILGKGRFMVYLVSLFDHLGRLLALLGINPVHEQYITD